MKYFWILLFIPSILSAEVIGYKYAIPKTETAVISDTTQMIGTKTDKERYLVLERKGISTTLDNYVKSGKCYKAVKHSSSDGIGTRVWYEGTIPADLNYSTEAENKKLIEKEVQRLKALENKELEEQAIKNLGLK